MAEKQTMPYVCHVLVCTNDRHGERKSCADGDNPAVRKQLKDEVKKRGWLGKVRVSQCGCMGLCAGGPNVAVYPHKIWFADVRLEDVGGILDTIQTLLDDTA